MSGSLNSVKNLLQSSVYDHVINQLVPLLNARCPSHLLLGYLLPSLGWIYDKKCETASVSPQYKYQASHPFSLGLHIVSLSLPRSPASQYLDGNSQRMYHDRSFSNIHQKNQWHDEYDTRRRAHKNSVLCTRPFSSMIVVSISPGRCSSPLVSHEKMILTIQVLRLFAMPITLPKEGPGPV